MVQPTVGLGSSNDRRSGDADRRKTLSGVVDLHIHSGPDIFPRRVTAVEAATAANEVGMAAILLKSHSTDTAARAEMVRTATGFPAYGGVVLNYPVGGLNPHAVVETARQGGRCVWMPTISAKSFIAGAPSATMLRAAIPPNARGLVASNKGRLLASVERILDAIAEHDLMLASGHFAAEDIALVFEAAAARGIERMVVNHAEAEFMHLSTADILHLTRLGAFIEISKMGSITERAELIRRIGVEHCYLATDGGPVSDPAPVDLMSNTILGLREFGFSQDEIKYLSVTVPSYLLALDPSSSRPRFSGHQIRT